MKNMHCLIIAAVLAVALAGSAFSQEPSLTKNVGDSRQELQVGAYLPHAAGNQGGVREFDGRSFNNPGIELFDTYGYRNSTQFWFNARDVLIGDEEINFGLASRNFLRFSGGTNVLSHLLSPVPAVNPWAAAQLTAIGAPAPVQGVTWDTFKDLSPGSDYYILRRVNQLNLYMNPDSRQQYGLTAGWWQETDDGHQQFLFRARQASSLLNNRDRASIRQRVERETNQGILGGDLSFGKSTAINYRFVATKFDDGRPGIASGSALDFSPLNTLTQFGSSTNSNVIKARTRITDRLSFTGVNINKERTNNESTVPTGYVGAGARQGNKVKIDSTNLALNYRATDSLSFMGRWRRLDWDNLTPPIFSSATSTTPANQALSSEETSTEFEGVFTGIPKMFLRAGYERRDIERKAGELQPGNDDIILPATSLNTDWSIWRAAVRYHPFVRLNLAADYQNWSADDSGFAGIANERTRTNVNATYLVTDTFAVYGNLSQWDESNDQIRVTGPIPTPATDTASEEIRVEAAGQGFDSKFRTANVGAWYALNNKLTLNADYGSVDMDSSALWIIGYEPAYVPHLAPDFVPYRSSDNQWSLGLNYVVSPKLKFRGGFFRSKADGASYVTPADFVGLGPEWTPVRIKQNRWSLGFGYGVSKKDTLGLDFSFAKWTDEVDSNNTGLFQLWRLSWARQF